MNNEKNYRYTFVALMSLGMTLVMSFTSTIYSERLSSQFLQAWLNTTILGFIVAFPTALIINPIAKWDSVESWKTFWGAERPKEMAVMQKLGSRISVNVYEEVEDFTR